MGKTETTLAQFALNYPTQDIPADVMHLAKRCVMNSCGVALFATLDPAINILLDFLRVEGCAPQATVIGSGLRTSPQNAALANGFLGHFEDYDDTHTTVIHPTAPIMPAVLALSEQHRVSGKDFLGAFAIGVDVACRIGLVIYRKFRDGAAHWHITQYLRRAWRCGGSGPFAQAQRATNGLRLCHRRHASAAACARCSVPCASRFTLVKQRKTVWLRPCCAARFHRHRRHLRRGARLGRHHGQGSRYQ